MIKASGNAKLVIIGANDGTPTVKSAHGDAPNSHTFISFTNAIQETAMIEKTLAKLRPDLAETFAKNAAAYVVKLGGLRADAAKRLAGAMVKRVVTVHDGYAISARTSASTSRGSSSRRTGSCPRRASSPR